MSAVGVMAPRGYPTSSERKTQEFAALVKQVSDAALTRPVTTLSGGASEQSLLWGAVNNPMVMSQRVIKKLWSARQNRPVSLSDAAQVWGSQAGGAASFAHTGSHATLPPSITYAVPFSTDERGVAYVASAAAWQAICFRTTMVVICDLLDIRLMRGEPHMFPTAVEDALIVQDALEKAGLGLLVERREEQAAKLDSALTYIRDMDLPYALAVDSLIGMLVD